MFLKRHFLNARIFKDAFALNPRRPHGIVFAKKNKIGVGPKIQGPLLVIDPQSLCCVQRSRLQSLNHCATWKSGCKKSQIDFILLSRRAVIFMDEPVAVAKCCTHSIMLAMLPHRVVVPATNAWLFRTSTAICPNWCVPSCKPRAEIASVTRTRPITTDDSYLLLFLLQHNRVVSLLWISLHMPACMQRQRLIFLHLRANCILLLWER